MCERACVRGYGMASNAPDGFTACAYVLRVSFVHGGKVFTEERTLRAWIRAPQNSAGMDYGIFFWTVC